MNDANRTLVVLKTQNNTRTLEFQVYENVNLEFIEFFHDLTHYDVIFGKVVYYHRRLKYEPFRKSK